MTETVLEDHRAKQAEGHAKKHEQTMQLANGISGQTSMWE